MGCIYKQYACKPSSSAQTSSQLTLVARSHCVWRSKDKLNSHGCTTDSALIEAEASRVFARSTKAKGDKI